MIQATTKLDKPGYARVKVRGEIRADASPRYRATGKYRPVTENLRHCGRCCWGADEMFSTDTRCYNKDKKTRNPCVILVPEEDQGNPAVVPDGGDKAHQLRTLIPQKVTYLLMRLRIVETQGVHLLTKREITEMITIPMLNKV
jgi:hypothetical protein